MIAGALNGDLPTLMTCHWLSSTWTSHTKGERWREHLFIC